MTQALELDHVELLDAGPTWVGRSLLRVEDERLLTGAGRFVGGHDEPDMLHIVFVRSFLAHAGVRSIDGAAAAKMPGVRAVLAASDLAELQALPINLTSLDVSPTPRAVLIPMPVIASGRVRFVGEAVAAVVATSFAEAVDAAELVEVDYEPLPAVVDARGATEQPPLHDEAPDNVLLRAERGSGDVEAAFAHAAFVVEGHFDLPRVVAAPMEPRGAVARYDVASDIVTLYVASQDPHRPRANLAAVLGRPLESVRVVVEDVGGSFGSKGSLAPEAAVAAFAAIRLRAPVRWNETRSENFLAAPQGRGQHADARLALDATGRFLGLQVSLVADLGAYLRPDTLVPPMIASSLMAGVYDISAVAVELVGVATNKVPTGPYRGAGRPEGAFVSERLADLAARRMGMDPIEIRRRNMIPPGAFPFRTAVGEVIDSANFPYIVDRLTKMVDYEGTRARHALERARGRLPGLGVAVFLEPAGRGLWEGASLTVGRDGLVVAQMGSSSHGQGHETTFSQVLADALGVEPGVVSIRFGDSDEVPEGMGTFASRSAMLAGSALMMAADDLIEQACSAAAMQMGCERTDVTFARGRVVNATGGSLSLAEIGAATELSASGRFNLEAPLFVSGAFAVEIEIDGETGALDVRRIVAVHDGGRILNPAIAEGQINGGALQGLGEALVEIATYDEDGQPTSGSFVSYGILSAVESPPITGEFTPPSSVSGTPVGAKGIGESGATGLPVATANAVADALGVLGRDCPQMPFGPERLWRAIQGLSEVDL